MNESRGARGQGRKVEEARRQPGRYDAWVSVDIRGLPQRDHRTMNITFPGETASYREARERLLEKEIELRRATEAVAGRRGFQSRRVCQSRTCIINSIGNQRVRKHILGQERDRS